MLKYAWRVAPAAVQLVQPVHQRGHELVSHLDIVATTARRNAKRVIRLRHYHEACVCAELRNDTSQQRHVSERVTITLRAAANPAMKGCVIPAPAPCAKTKHARAAWGRVNRPDTDWAS
jgi:hypothetical protein